MECVFIIFNIKFYQLQFLAHLEGCNLVCLKETKELCPGYIKGTSREARWMECP